MKLKLLLAAVFLAGLGLVVFGTPFAPAGIERAPRFGGTLPVLPMRFALADHTGVGCVTCHHEFVDRRMDRGCMACHVTDAKVAPLLEDQFHGLCRSCHVSEHAAGKPAGPTRRCQDCHRPDAHF